MTAALLIGLVWWLLRRGEPRVAAAFVVAPLTAPVILTLETLHPLTALFTTMFTYPLALLPGIPAYFLLRRMGWLQPWWIVGVSAVLAGAIGFVFSGNPSYAMGVAVRRALFFGALGAATGLVFWVVAFAGLRSNNRRREP